jgi:hypothetical protein
MPTANRHGVWRTPTCITTAPLAARTGRQPAQRRQCFRSRILNVVRSAASLAPVVAIVCYVLRRNKFRFGHAV